MTIKEKCHIKTHKDHKICYLHLDITSKFIECKCYYHGHETEFTLSHTHYGQFLFDNESKCEDYFDKLCKGLLENDKHPLHGALKGKKDLNLPYCDAIVVTYNVDKGPDQPCEKLKFHFVKVLKIFIKVCQFYFCKSQCVFYFHTDYCLYNKHYITPHILYALYSELNGSVCPVPLNIDLNNIDQYTPKKLEAMAYEQYKQMQDGGYSEESMMHEGHGPSYMEHTSHMGHNHHPYDNHGHDYDYQNSSHDSYGQHMHHDPYQGSHNHGQYHMSDPMNHDYSDHYGRGRHDHGHHHDSSSYGTNHHHYGDRPPHSGNKPPHHNPPHDSKNLSTCAFNAPPTNVTPLVTLGKCFKWDTKRCHGYYKIDIPACMDERSKTPNTHSVARYLYCYNGAIAWCTECHGVTTVCMENVCQLIDALDDPLQLSLLVEGKPNVELRKELNKLCEYNKKLCNPGKNH